MLKAPDKEIRREDSKNKNFSEDLAFRHGPRHDGIVRMKDGNLLLLHDLPSPTTKITLTKVKSDQERRKDLHEDEPIPPRWNHHILAHQRRNLKMRYKVKTKLRAKLMREIRKSVKKVTIS